MKYKYNLKAFEEITNESAYFLGLLYADGNLSDRGRVTLNLSIKDIFDVDTTLKNVDSNTTSRYRNVCFNKRTKRWRAAYYLNNIRKEKSFPTEEEAFNFLNSEDYFL